MSCLLYACKIFDYLIMKANLAYCLELFSSLSLFMEEFGVFVSNLQLETSGFLVPVFFLLPTGLMNGFLELGLLVKKLGGDVFIFQIRLMKG